MFVEDEKQTWKGEHGVEKSIDLQPIVVRR